MLCWQILPQLLLVQIRSDFTLEVTWVYIIVLSNYAIRVHGSLLICPLFIMMHAPEATSAEKRSRTQTITAF